MFGQRRHSHTDRVLHNRNFDLHMVLIGVVAGRVLLALVAVLVVALVRLLSSTLRFQSYSSVRKESFLG